MSLDIDLTLVVMVCSCEEPKLYMITWKDPSELLIKMWWYKLYDDNNDNTSKYLQND